MKKKFTIDSPRSTAMTANDKVLRAAVSCKLSVVSFYKLSAVSFSEELRLLLQMKRTSKLILLLMGFVAASCILQLAIVVNHFNTDEIHQYVDRQIPLVSPDTLWGVFKPVSTPETIDHQLKNIKD